MKKEEVELLFKKGDKIFIDMMIDEPSYRGRTGVVEYIDDIGQLHGTWGGLALICNYDKFHKVEE